jgi:hypothetical protein
MYYSKRLLCFLIVAIFLVACNTKQIDGSQTQASAVVTEPATPLNLPPTAARNTNQTAQKLKEFFTEEQILQLKAVEKEFNAIKTAENLATFYQKTLPEVVLLVNKKINQYDPETSTAETSSFEKWAWFTDFMPYIHVNLFCSECGTEAYIVVNPLRDKAEITDTKADDLFFDALLTAYQGEQKELVCDKKPNNWVYLVNCDLCGADILGNNKHLNTLKALMKAQKESTLFEEDLNELRKQAMPYQVTNYYYPKEKVLKELEAIIALEGLTGKEKESLKNIRYLINTSKDVQFDCQTGNCQFLAM